MNFQQRSEPDGAAGHAVAAEGFVDAAAHRLPDRVEPRECGFIEQLHRRDPGAHRHRIGRKGPAMRQRRLAGGGIEHRHEFPLAADRADRKAAAHDLAERGQIGIDIPKPLRAAIAEAEGDDLVEDQQRADLARDRRSASR